MYHATFHEAFSILVFSTVHTKLKQDVMLYNDFSFPLQVRLAYENIGIKSPEKPQILETF